MTEKPKIDGLSLAKMRSLADSDLGISTGGQHFLLDVIEEYMKQDAAFLAMLEALKSALPSEQEGVYEISASVVDEVVAQAEAVRK